ncbi:MAG: BLUF domain-containing protein [Pseudomonadota bacterium]
MSPDINKLIRDYEHADSELRMSFAGNATPSDGEVAKLDKELTKTFKALISAELTDKASHLRRLNFFISVLEEMESSTGIAQQILSKIRQDANATVDYDTSFPINVIPLTNSTQICCDDLVEIGYSSRSTKLLSASEIEELCTNASRFNSEHNVTGMLFYDYSTQNIFQILEGPETTLLKLMDSIKDDSRHTEIRLCFYNHIKARSFDKWAMTKITLSDLFVEVPHINEIGDWFNSKFLLDKGLSNSMRHTWVIEKLQKYYRKAV